MQPAKVLEGTYVRIYVSFNSTEKGPNDFQLRFVPSCAVPLYLCVRTKHGGGLFPVSPCPPHLGGYPILPRPSAVRFLCRRQSRRYRNKTNDRNSKPWHIPGSYDRVVNIFNRDMERDAFNSSPAQPPPSTVPPLPPPPPSRTDECEYVPLCVGAPEGGGGASEGKGGYGQGTFRTLGYEVRDRVRGWGVLCLFGLDYFPLLRVFYFWVLPLLFSACGRVPVDFIVLHRLSLVLLSFFFLLSFFIPFIIFCRSAGWLAGWLAF